MAGAFEKVKQGMNAVSENVQETFSGASKEANKSVAKDSNASASTRLTATKDAASDKLDEMSHGAKGEAHEQAAKH